MTNGTLTIYRFVDPAVHLTEDSAESKIEFNGGILPDATGHSESAIYTGSRRRTDVENAFDNNTNKPDTGSAGFFVDISFVMDETVAESLIADKLGDWDAEGTSTEAMPNGQLGLRNDKRTRFNLKPSIDSGYKLVEVQIFDDEKNGNLVPGRLLLEHSGDKSKLGVQI